MKIIGFLLMVVGIVGIIVTILQPALFGWSGIFAGATAILTGAVFASIGYRAGGGNRGHGC